MARDTYRHNLDERSLQEDAYVAHRFEGALFLIEKEEDDSRVLCSSRQWPVSLMYGRCVAVCLWAWGAVCLEVLGSVRSQALCQGPEAAGKCCSARVVLSTPWLRSCAQGCERRGLEQGGRKANLYRLPRCCFFGASSHPTAGQICHCHVCSHGYVMCLEDVGAQFERSDVRLAAFNPP